MGQYDRSLLFSRTFLRHPRMLGSVIPSSRYLAEHLLRQIDWSGARVLVEYGPGIGNLTTQILDRMRPDARLVAIELSEDFVGYLARTIKDPRFTVVHGSAGDVRPILARLGLDQADCILSGLPYSTLPPRERDRILSETYEALAPGGSLLVYQFTGAVERHLTRLFGRVRKGFELRNILPARTFACVKETLADDLASAA